jgi:hypothetical protein
VGKIDSTLLQLLILTFIIHCIDTFAYSVRLNSVKSGQYALSFSFFNLFYIVSLIAHSFQAPLIGRIIDLAYVSEFNPLPTIRRVISTATLGTLFGIILTPTFLKCFSIAVGKLEKSGSLPSIVIDSLHFYNLKNFREIMTRPSFNMISKLPFREIPKEILFLNICITGIYTIGVLSAFYASLLVSSEHRMAASASAGVITGVANIILMLFVDPKSAVITDQAFKGSRPYRDVKALVVLLMSSKLFGTLLGQLLLIPLARCIARFFAY